MSMDVLNKAAKAAGYAMATPDEDTLGDPKWIGPSGEAPGRGLPVTFNHPPDHGTG